MSRRPGITLQPVHLNPFIEQVAGPDKGKIFELGSTELTIGRAQESDIVVSSEAVSRLHARLAQSDGNWFIRDNDSKNGILVNGKSCRESWLQAGDIVQVGDFVFRFNDPTEAEPAAPLTRQPEVSSEANVPSSNPSNFGTAPAMQKPKRSRRPLIYGMLILVVGLYLITLKETPPAEKTDPDGSPLARDFKLSEAPNLNPEDRPKTLVGLEDPILKEAEKAMLGLDWTNTSLRQAEQFFKKGQREFLNQNYHRAIEFFQTALQLFRGHLLAERYLKRSIYEAELEAKAQMALGLQYYSTLQYQRAMYHFNEVIVLMAHRPTEPVSATAAKYIEQCRKMLRAAELFP